MSPLTNNPHCLEQFNAGLNGCGIQFYMSINRKPLLSESQLTGSNSTPIVMLTASFSNAFRLLPSVRKSIKLFFNLVYRLSKNSHFLAFNLVIFRKKIGTGSPITYACLEKNLPFTMIFINRNRSLPSPINRT